MAEEGRCSRGWYIGGCEGLERGCSRRHYFGNVCRGRRMEMGWMRRGRKSELPNLTCCCCCCPTTQKSGQRQHYSDNIITMVHQESPSNSILLLHPLTLDPTHFVSRQSSFPLRALETDHPQDSSPKTFLSSQIQNQYRGPLITSITPPTSSSNLSQFHRTRRGTTC